MMDTIAAGGDAHLDSINPDEPLVDGLRREEPGYPYSLGRALERRGLPEAARRVYLQELDRGVVPWNGYSADRLAAIAAQRQQWLAAEGYASRGVEMLPTYADLWFRLGDALYRQEQYSILQDATQRFPLDEVDHFARYSPQSVQAERYLWQAVAAWELGGDVEQAFIRAFTAVPAGEIHTRLYLYLFYRSGALAQFSPWIRDLLEAVYRIANGEHSEGLRLLRRIDPERMAELVGENPSLVATMRGAHRAVDGPAEQWIRAVASYGPPAGDPGMTRLLAEIAEQRGRRAEAMELLAAAGEFTPWVQAAIRDSRDLTESVDFLLARNVSEADLILAVDRLLPVMIRDRRWQEIEELYQRIPLDFVPLRAHLGVVTALAGQEGFLPAMDLETRLAPALEQDGLTYFRVVAHRLAGTALELPGEARVDPPRDQWPPALQHAAALLQAGLVEESRSMAMAAAVDPEAAEGALGFARVAHQLGYQSVALDVGRRAINRGALTPTAEDIPLLYPRPFAVEIESAATDYRVAPAVLYGLIREESHFNPRARSHVGATGLSQIMPATAEDLQRRLRWPAVDLESVSENTRMGAFYLDYLAGQLPDSLVIQLGAYNAGLGRGRNWMASFGDLPPALQIEALPFIETRWYLRRIVVSSGWYQYQLDGSDPAEANPTLR